MSSTAATGNGDPGPILISHDDLNARIADLGNCITNDYQGRAPLLVGVLKGAFVFMADLARAINLPVEFDFMARVVLRQLYPHQRRGADRERPRPRSGRARRDPGGGTIIDSGLTLNYLRKNLHARNPASLEVCALLVRKGRQHDDLDLRYVGFEIPPDFVVGYGLDVGERYRQLPHICQYQPTSGK